MRYFYPLYLNTLEHSDSTGYGINGSIEAKVSSSRSTELILKLSETD